MNIQLPDIFFLAFLILISLTLLCEVVWIFSTEKRLKRFFLGKKAKDLEDTIVALEKNIEKLKSNEEKIQKDILEINQKLKKSVRGLETLRFNPFPDQGSNQSFAIGMLNEEGDGVVLSSLYSRERMSVFAKPIKGGKSEYGLTEEEEKVIKNAKI